MKTQFEVKPTDDPRLSLLVLPDRDPEYYTPQLSVKMETDLAKKLAHAANVLPGLVGAVAKIVSSHDKYPVTGGPACSCGTCRVLKPELARAENVETNP